MDKLQTWCLKTLNSFTDLCNRIFKYIKSSPVWRLTGVLYLVAFLMMITSLVSNYFTVPLGGDFSLQFMPFMFNGYDDWWEAIKTGGNLPLFDESVFLGVNNIGANSFYYIFSPFFLVSLLCPRFLLPQFQAFMMMSKLVLGGVFFYYFLGAFNLKTRTKQYGAVVYAFCGWNIFYLWFFHFQDASIMIPLVLLGIEKLLKDKKPALLMLSLGLMGLTDYFFFVIICFGSVMYAVFRYFQTIKSRNSKDNLFIIGLGISTYAIAVLISCVALLPSLACVSSMPRVTGDNYFTKLLDGSFNERLKLLFIWEDKNQAYFSLSSFLFMTNNCFSSSLFPNKGYNNMTSSIYVYIPLMLMLIPSIFDSIRTKKFSHLLGVALSLILIFTPFSYYLFHAFSTDFGYGRWQIFIIAWLIPFELIHFENRKEMPKTYLDAGFLFTLGMMAIVLIRVFTIQGDLQGFGSAFNELKEKAYLIPVQFVELIAIYIYMRIDFQKSRLTKNLIMVTAVEAIIMGTITIQMHGLDSYGKQAGGLDNVNTETKIFKYLNDYDDSSYRVYNTSADRGNVNLMMKEGYNGMSTFHSTFNFNQQDFIDHSRVSYTQGNWSMGIHEKRYKLDNFIGVKYYLLKDTDQNVPFGFVDLTEVEGDKKISESFKNYLVDSKHRLYLNTNYIDLGYLFDTVTSNDMIRYYPGSSGSRTADTYENYYMRTGIVNKFIEPVLDENDETIKEGYDADLEEILKAAPNLTKGTYAPLKYKEMNEYKTIIKKPVWIDGKWGGFQKDINGNEIEFDYNSTNYSSNQSNTLYVMTPKPATIPLLCSGAIKGQEETSCYISALTDLRRNVELSFYNKEGKVINKDTHLTQWYDKNGNYSEWKMGRGFYVDEPVYKVEMVTKETLAKDNYIKAPTFIEESYGEYLKLINKQKNNGIKNIEHWTDHYRFEIDNDDQDKFAVLHVPFDAGWSLKRTAYDVETQEKVGASENIKLYNAQGGFVGFIASKNPDSIGANYDYQYELSYYTPALKEGLQLTAVGIVLAAVTLSIPFIKPKKPKVEELEA